MFCLVFRSNVVGGSVMNPKKYFLFSFELNDLLHQNHKGVYITVCVYMYKSCRKWSDETLQDNGTPFK